MDGFKSWALSITVSVLAGGIVYIISPKGSTAKIVRTGVSLFIIFMIFSPLAGGINVDLSSSYLNGEQTVDNDFEAAFQNQLFESIEEASREQIEAVLEAHKIKKGQIKIITDINGEGSIFIKEITVTLSDEYKNRLSEISSFIRKETGFSAEVVT